MSRRIATWPMPHTERRSGAYSLEVEGVDVPVWLARVREAISKPESVGWTSMLNGPTEWASFARCDAHYPVTISGRLNSDGINTGSSSRVTVRRTFVRSHDDSFAVKTTDPDRPATQVLYEDCVAGDAWGPRILLWRSPVTVTPAPGGRVTLPQATHTPVRLPERAAPVISSSGAGARRTRLSRPAAAWAPRP